MNQQKAFGQEFNGFIVGVAVHYALIPGAAGVNTLGDVRRLGGNVYHNLQFVFMADVAINLSGDFLKINFGV